MPVDPFGPRLPLRQVPTQRKSLETRTSTPSERFSEPAVRRALARNFISRRRAEANPTRQIPMGAGGVAGAGGVRAIPSNAMALLNAIAASESAYRPGEGYDVLYTNNAWRQANPGQPFRRFTDYSRHPLEGAAQDIFNTIDTGGEGNPTRGRMSRAAGRYQFLPRTWARAASNLNLTDFSPENQDTAAWWLANEAWSRHSTIPLEQAINNPELHGQIARALSPIWTSLPGGQEQGQNLSIFSQRLSGETATPEGRRLTNFVRNETPPATRDIFTRQPLPLPEQPYGPTQDPEPPPSPLIPPNIIGPVVQAQNSVFSREAGPMTLDRARLPGAGAPGHFPPSTESSGITPTRPMSLRDHYALTPDTSEEDVFQYIFTNPAATIPANDPMGIQGDPMALTDPLAQEIRPLRINPFIPQGPRGTLVKSPIFRPTRR